MQPRIGCRSAADGTDAVYLSFDIDCIDADLSLEQAGPNLVDSYLEKLCSCYSL